MKCTEPAQPTSEVQMKQKHAHGMRWDGESPMQHQAEAAKILEQKMCKNMHFADGAQAEGNQRFETMQVAVHSSNVTEPEVAQQTVKEVSLENKHGTNSPLHIKT